MVRDLRPELLKRFLLEDVSALSSLGDEARTALAARFTARVLSPGETLVHEGDRLRGLKVVHSGILEVSAPGPDGHPRRLGWRGRGEVIGEAGLLTGKAATETVTARRHALVLTLDPDICEQVLGRDSAVAAALATSWLARLAPENRRPRPGAFVFAAVPIGLPKLDGLESAFQEACRHRSRTAFLWQREAPEATGPDVTPELTAWFHDREAAEPVALAFTADADDGWGRATRARADCVLCLVPESPQPSLLDRLQPVLEAARKAEIVLVSRDPEGQASAAWARAVPDRRLIEIAGDNVGQLTGLLDMLFVEHGDYRSLRRFATFADLGDAELELLYDDLSLMPVPGGTTLFTQGDVDDDVYLVGGGRFQATHRDGHGEHVISEFGVWETVGETTALTDPTRPVSLRAVRDSFVGRLRGEVFRAHMEELPALARNVSRVLAARLRELGPRLEPLTTERPPGNVAVVPLTDSPAARGLGRALAETLSTLQLGHFGLDAHMVDTHLGRGISQTRTEGPGAAILERWLMGLEDEHERVLYLCDDGDSPWTARSLRQADLVLFVGDAGADPGLRDVERPLIEADRRLARPHLVLIQRPDAREGRDTARWLEHRPGVTHHHVREDSGGDRARLLRRILMRAAGIAFSGASSRGVAHLGVLRGYDACGLPLDLISGSSSGAAIAALATLGLPHDEMLQKATAFLSAVVPTLTQFQPPLTSLLSGKVFEEHLREGLGERRMEDQLIPCTLTGVDINHHRLVPLQTGPMWLAVRASCSLPVFWPPVWSEDRLLVDGGIQSNMPIEEILGECSRGMAVASDLNVGSGEERPAFEGYEHYGATLSSWRTLAERLTPGGKTHRYPNIGDVLLNAMCIPSFAQQRRLRHLENEPHVRFVRPPLPYEGFFSVDAETSRRYEQLAYETALQTLEGARGQVLNLELRHLQRALSTTDSQFKT